MEGICVNFLDQGQFSDSTRDVAMATNFVVKLPIPLALIALSILNSATNATTWCKILVKIGSSSFREDANRKCVACSAYFVEYLRIY